MLDVKDWKTPETYFSWTHVQTYIDRIDATVYRVAIEIAQDLFLDQAPSCPKCGKPAAELIWLSVSTPLADWQAGHGRVGFLTLCAHCEVQAAFIVDDELTKIQAEEFARSGMVD